VVHYLSAIHNLDLGDADVEWFTSSSPDLAGGATTFARYVDPLETNVEWINTPASGFATYVTADNLSIADPKQPGNVTIRARESKYVAA